MSIREISHYVIIQTVEDGDHILETPTPFVFSANYKSILSLPDASFRRYIQKMVALGGTEPQETYLALMNERIISVGNCTAELVAQLPSIRVQFTDPSLMHIELEPADFIQVNNESQTCTLALDINADQMVLTSTVYEYANEFWRCYPDLRFNGPTKTDSRILIPEDRSSE